MHIDTLSRKCSHVTFSASSLSLSLSLSLFLSLSLSQSLVARFPMRVKHAPVEIVFSRTDRRPPVRYNRRVSNAIEVRQRRHRVYVCLCVCMTGDRCTDQIKWSVYSPTRTLPSPPPSSRQAVRRKENIDWQTGAICCKTDRAHFIIISHVRRSSSVHDEAKRGRSVAATRRTDEGTDGRRDGRTDGRTDGGRNRRPELRTD